MSVETSSNASSTATTSPTAFNQRVTVPSLTLSPRAGIVITVPAPTGAETGGGVTGAATTGAATTGVSIFISSTTGAATTGATFADESELSAIIASSAPTGTV